MAKIIRYNGNLVPFASASLGTERTIFGDAAQADDITSQFTPEFLRGWGIVGPSDQPTLQDFNAVSYTHGQVLAYLHQVGIAEYNAAQEYHIGSVCNVAGVMYTSLINTNVGNTPISSPSQWKPLGSGQLLRTTLYINTAGVLQSSVDGSAFANASSTFTGHPNAVFADVEVQGAGGSGGNTGAVSGGEVAVASGGAGGGWARKRMLSTAINGQTITVGAGGGAGAEASGGSSSIASLISASGGPPGVTGPSLTQNGLPFEGAAGGMGVGGDMNGLGGFGGSAWYSAVTSISGKGGSSVYGDGGALKTSTVAADGTSAVSYGAGGGGAAAPGPSGATKFGGAGKSGIIIIREYA